MEDKQNIPDAEVWLQSFLNTGQIHTDFLPLENEIWREITIIYFMLSKACHLRQRLTESEEKYRLCPCNFWDSPLKCLNMTQFETKGACFALQLFHPPVQSKVLVTKTIIRQAAHYLPQRLDTPLFTSTINLLLHSTSVIGFFGCIQVFLCVLVLLVFLIGNFYLTLDHNFFTFHKSVSAKLFFQSSAQSDKSNHGYTCNQEYTSNQGYMFTEVRC